MLCPGAGFCSPERHLRTQQGLLFCHSIQSAALYLSSDSQFDSMETFYDSIQGPAIAQSLPHLICNYHNGSSVSFVQEVIEDAVRHMLKSGLKAALGNPKPGNDEAMSDSSGESTPVANDEPAPMEGIEGMNAD